MGIWIRWICGIRWLKRTYQSRCWLSRSNRKREISTPVFWACWAKWKTVLNSSWNRKNPPSSRSNVNGIRPKFSTSSLFSTIQDSCSLQSTISSPLFSKICSSSTSIGTISSPTCSPSSRSTRSGTSTSNTCIPASSNWAKIKGTFKLTRRIQFTVICIRSLPPKWKATSKSSKCSVSTQTPRWMSWISTKQFKKYS